MSYTGHGAVRTVPDRRLSGQLECRLDPLKLRTLTPVEQHTLALLAEGNPRAEIAARRAVTIETVKTTFRRIRSVLGPLGAAGLVDCAYRTAQLPIPPYRAHPPGVSLNDDQQQLLILLATGTTTRKIATATHHSNETVKARVTALRSRLDARTIAHAVHLAWQYRYLTPALRSAGSAGSATTAGRKRPAYGYMRACYGLGDEQVYQDEQKMLYRAQRDGYDLRAIYHEEDDGSISALSALVDELKRTRARAIIVPSLAHLGTSPVLQHHLRAYVIRSTHADVLTAEAQG